jgi:hypothetical protein
MAVFVVKCLGGVDNSQNDLFLLDIIIQKKSGIIKLIKLLALLVRLELYLIKYCLLNILRIYSMIALYNFNKGSMLLKIYKRKLRLKQGNVRLLFATSCLHPDKD